MSDTLSQLKKHSVIVADTGDFKQLKEFSPQDSTTNPSLLLAASALAEYEGLISAAVTEAKATGLKGEELLSDVCDRMAVNFGKEILKIVPGVVSTEVDANLSFDKNALLQKARKLIKLYEDSGIKRERILIKMASTWEGCEAAKQLESEGIHCNMTLLFSLCQAIAAAEAGATLISPFVGRILDWHKAKNSSGQFDGLQDPGVVSVREIYSYYKQHGYKTIVMGASFRNTGEILNLAGCDKLTISPKLLKELQESTATVEKQLTSEFAKKHPMAKIPMNEATFRWMLNEDQMATEKLSDGIRLFNADLVKLKKFVAGKI